MHVAVVPTTEAKAKEEAKVAVQLEVLRMTDPNADHRANANSIVPSLVNKPDMIGIGFYPDFSFFNVTYVSGVQSFIAVMPVSFATALRTTDSFIATTMTCTYKIQALKENFVTQDRRIDTGFKWAVGILSVGATDSVKEVEQAATAALANVNLKLVRCEALVDKSAGGTGTGRVRIAFDTLQDFDPLQLHKIKSFKLPSTALVTLKPSAELCSFYNIHNGCLKSLDRRAPAHLVCTCGSGSSSGPSMARASVQKAQEDYRARALKRAREVADPFD